MPYCWRYNSYITWHCLVLSSHRPPVPSFHNRTARYKKAYRISGKFGDDLNLTIWRSDLKWPNLNSPNINSPLKRACAVLYKRWFGPDKKMELTKIHSSYFWHRTVAIHSVYMNNERAIADKKKRYTCTRCFEPREHLRASKRKLTFCRLQPRRLQIWAIERSILQCGRPTQHGGEKMTEGEPSTAPPN